MPFDTQRLTPYVGPPVGPSRDAGARSRSGPRRRDARSSTSGRTWSAGCASRCAATRARDHAAARGGARARRARASARCGPPRPPTGSCSAGATTSSSRPRRSTVPLRRGHGLAGAVDARTRSRPSSCTRTCAVSATSRAPTTCSTSSTPTWCGACGATSWTCPATARNATSGSGGPATSRSFAPSAAFLYDVDDFLRDWLLDLALEQQAQDGLVPFVVPDALKYEEHPTEFPRARDRRDLERRGRVGAVGAVAGVRRPAGARGPVRLDGRPPDAASSRWSRRRGCGTPASSSATGWTRRRRPTSRSSPGPTAEWWRPRARSGPPASWPSPRR